MIAIFKVKRITTNSTNPCFILGTDVFLQSIFKLYDEKIKLQVLH